MALPLTIDEKAQTLRFLRYPNWESLAQSFQLGFPSEGQPEFLVRMAFDRISEASLDLIRKDLCELNQIECQFSDARSRFKATSIGELKINQNEIRMLEREDTRWRRKLADDLGVYQNPWSNENMEFGGNGNMSARVLVG
jgi:hypothetical protein